MASGWDWGLEWGWGCAANGLKVRKWEAVAGGPRPVASHQLAAKKSHRPHRQGRRMSVSAGDPVCPPHCPEQTKARPALKRSERSSCLPAIQGNRPSPPPQSRPPPPKRAATRASQTAPPARPTRSSPVSRRREYGSRPISAARRGCTRVLEGKTCRRPRSRIPLRDCSHSHAGDSGALDAGAGQLFASCSRGAARPGERPGRSGAGYWPSATRGARGAGEVRCRRATGLFVGKH